MVIAMESYFKEGIIIPAGFGSTELWCEEEKGRRGVVGVEKSQEFRRFSKWAVIKGKRDDFFGGVGFEKNLLGEGFGHAVEVAIVAGIEVPLGWSWIGEEGEGGEK